MVLGSAYRFPFLYRRCAISNINLFIIGLISKDIILKLRHASMITSGGYDGMAATHRILSC
jgi:hypothetical protein